MELEQLMAKAKTARPEKQEKYAVYLPIMRVLIEERAHSIKEATRWLVAQGEIPKANENGAYTYFLSKLKGVKK